MPDRCRHARGTSVKRPREGWIAYADGNRTFHILDGNRVNVLIFDAIIGYELWRGIQFFIRGYSKSVDYLSGTPPMPLEKPYGFFAIGGKALF